MPSKRITDRKVQNVSLRSSFRHFALTSGFTIKSDSLAGEYQTDDWGRTWKRIVRVDVYIDGYSLEDAITNLRNAAEGLASPVTTVTDMPGDESYVVTVRGMRDATEEEVAEVLRYLVFEKEEKTERDAVQRERFIAMAKKFGLKPEDLV